MPVSKLTVQNEDILPYLSAAQMTLFRRMQPAEQAHAFSVFHRLRAAGQRDGCLLLAALLHDVGKILRPLSLHERIIAVVGRWLFPRLHRSWGQGAPRGWRRPFVVSAHHAVWGADLAAHAGASPLTVSLIRRHQDTPLSNPKTREDRLLSALQRADEMN